MSDSIDRVLGRQLGWAKDAALELYDEPRYRLYLRRLTDNLFAGNLSPDAMAAYAKGKGSELVDVNGQPAKMKALHSSSALVANVFDYWTGRDPAPLASALGIGAGIRSVKLEATFDTGLGGTPPHLDALLTDGNDIAIAIESKFTEWMTGKSFASAYFRGTDGAWAIKGLPECQRMADSTYNFLDVTQLLKHALGLATQRGRLFELHYLYFDVGGIEGDRHRAEIGRFTDCVGSEVRFKSASYQEVFRRLKERSQPAESDYLAYLERRYFP